MVSSSIHNKQRSTVIVSFCIFLDFVTSWLASGGRLPRACRVSITSCSVSESVPSHLVDFGESWCVLVLNVAQNNSPSNTISFMSDIVSTSGCVHSEFVCLLFLQDHREIDHFFFHLHVS